MIHIKRTALVATLGLTLLTPAFSEATALADSEAMTRGQFIQLITNELKLIPANKQAALPPDVSADSAYADAVRVMLERKAMNGYSDGMFRLEQPISKEEAGYILGRFLGIADSKASSVLQENFGADFGTETGLIKDAATALIKKSLATDPAVSQWLADAAKTQTNLTSFRADVDMKMSIAFKPGPGMGGNTSNFTTEINSAIEFNKNQGLHQTITTTAPGSDLAARTIKTEQYTVTHGTYMSLPNEANDGTVWYDMTKQMPFTFEELMKLQEKSTQVNQSLVAPYFFYKDLGTTEKDGKKLRQVEIHGKITNTADILKTLGGLGSRGQNMIKDLENSPALADMSVGLSAVLTLDEESKLPVSMNGDYIIAYGDDPENPIDHMDMSMTMVFKDYNQPINIVLPDEAKKAVPFTMPAVPAAE
ncbi:S-layer homology domain-containing protein [Paenibacillus sedimenti]|uniref:S-layer homology domain-containing protein n=1 Tax=Paenibacillus sedimenti TaxID=2770274 RepID=A0A926KSV3_9BACL|nr:S-layer homology domain-containing protein [Paenibacillus sedimenti]MBD0382296.1 S-layer homology domain-containing protein [Paenibacillus sedimenti]